MPTVAAQRSLEPAQLSRTIRGDLDWIVMKSLEKERSRRYETANGLARDIDRFLNDQPVEASPPSTAYRFRKFARRNRAMLSTIAIVAVTLLIGIIFSATQAIRATRAERIAQTHLTEANAARRESEENAAQARRVVDQFFTIVSESQLMEVPGLQPLRQQLLESALSYYQTFREQRAGDSSLRSEVAVIRLRIAQVYEQNNRIDDSIRELSDALSLIDDLRKQVPPPSGFPRNLAGFRKSGRIVTFLTLWPTDTDEAVRVYQRAISLWEHFAQNHADIVEFRCDLGSFYASLSDYQYHLDDFEGALRSAVRGKELLQPLLEARSDQPEYRSLLADLLEYESRSNIHSGRLQEAETVSQQAFEIRQKLVGDFPAIPAYRANMAFTNHRRAVVLLTGGHLQEALSLQQASADCWRQLLDEYPNVSGYRKQAAGNLAGVSKYHRRLGRFAESETNLRTAVELLARLADEDLGGQGDNLVELIQLRIDLFDALTSNGKTTEAEQQFHQIEAGVQKYAENFPDTSGEEFANTCRFAAIKAHDRNDFQMEERFLRLALKTYQRRAAAARTRHKDYSGYLVAETHRLLGLSLSKQNRLPDAEKEFRQAIAAREKAIKQLNEFPSNVPNWVGAYLNLADLLSRTNRAAEGQQILQQFLNSCERLPDGSALSPDAAERSFEVRRYCAGYLAKLNRLEEALEQETLGAKILLELNRKGLATPLQNNNLAWVLATRPEFNLQAPPTMAVELAKAAVASRPEEGNFWNTLGVAQYQMGDNEAAVSSLHKSMFLRKGGDATDWFFLADIAGKRGDTAAANDWYEAAFLWMAKHRRDDVELIRFRNHARELLQLPNSELPSEVEDLSIAKPLFRADPETPAVWCVEALLLDRIRNGQWSEAKPFALRRCELTSHESDGLYQLAGLLARVGDRDAHQRCCRELLDRYAESEEMEWVERSSKVSLLLPVTGQLLLDAFGLADRAAKKAPNHSVICNSFVTAALASYRQDRFDDAVSWADKALGCSYTQLTSREAQAYYIRAMALHRLGRRGDAMVSYESAAATLKKLQMQVLPNCPSNLWVDIAICELLHEEFNQLLAVSLM